MGKRGINKKINSKEKSTPKEKNVDKMLIENFVSLQKVMTNLSIKFDELSKNISKLLELFELSANALAKKEINITKPIDEKRILEQLESILTQNKVIARGLTLVHERISGQEETSIDEYVPKTLDEFKSKEQKPVAQTQQKFAPPLKVPSPHSNEGYQKSPFPKEFQ